METQTINETQYLFWEPEKLRHTQEDKALTMVSGEVGVLKGDPDTRCLGPNDQGQY